jgi:hypothetical protein
MRPCAGAIQTAGSKNAYSGLRLGSLAAFWEKRSIGIRGSGTQAPRPRHEHVGVPGNTPQAFGAGRQVDQGAFARQFVQGSTHRTQHRAGRNGAAISRLRQLQSGDCIVAVGAARMALQGFLRRELSPEPALPW